MLVLGDWKQLEWCTCVYLSQDPVGLEEINNRVDQHADNQKRFKLPSRLIAKKFLFRLTFGGTAKAYAYDHEFTGVSDNPKFWQKVIDQFYEKYQGVKTWHQTLMNTVMETGQIVLPTGRFFNFSATQRNGEYLWPRTTILNYPVQGLGAELMVLARVILSDLLTERNLRGILVGTVHDSVLTDCPTEEVEPIAGCMDEAWKKVPSTFEELFGVPYNLPCVVDISVGPSWGQMRSLEEYNKCVLQS